MLVRNLSLLVCLNRFHGVFVQFFGISLILFHLLTFFFSSFLSKKRRKRNQVINKRKLMKLDEIVKIWFKERMFLLSLKCHLKLIFNFKQQFSACVLLIVSGLSHWMFIILFIIITIKLLIVTF